MKKKIFSLNNFVDKEAECEDEMQSKNSNHLNLNSPISSLNNSINENMEYENNDDNNHKEMLKKIIKKEDEEIEKLIYKKYVISQNMKKPNIPFEKENKIMNKIFSKEIKRNNNNKEKKVSDKVHCLISPKKEENNDSNNDYENLKLSYEKKYKKLIHEKSSDFKRDFIKTIKEDNKILENVIEINKQNNIEKKNKKKKFIPYSQRVLNLHSQNSYLNKIKNKTQN